MKLTAFQIILLAAFGALAVAGVLIFAIATSSSGKTSVGPVVIWGTLDAATFSSVVQAAAAAGNSDLAQATYVQQNPSTYLSTLTQALASGQGPDLFLMTQDQALAQGPEAQAIPSASFSPAQFQNLFIQAANPFISQSGSIIAVPLVADPLVLYWNKDMLASVGLAQPPQYWDQLIPDTSALTLKDDAGNIKKSAIDFGEYQNVDHAKDVITTLIIQAGGTITHYDQGGRLVATIVPKSAAAGASVSTPALTALQFYTGFADPSSAEYTWNGSQPDGQQDFANGNLGLYVGFASEQAAIAKKNPNLNFAIAPLPQIRNAANTAVGVRVYALAVARTSKNPTGALTVAYDLANQSNSAAFAAAFTMASARRDVLAQSAQGMQDVINKAAIMSYSWIDPNPQATDGLFRAMIEDTTSGALSSVEAVSRADSQMTEIIGQ